LQEKVMKETTTDAVNTYYVSTIPLSDKEKKEQYKKLKKKELIKRLIQLEQMYEWATKPYQTYTAPYGTGTPINEIPCMHDNCQGCKDGTCSGVHMLSCPCPKCTPRC
jgi:hypothetical protein